MKSKKNLIILVLAVIIYFTLNYFYNMYINNTEYTYAYILNDSAMKGDSVSIDNFTKLKIQTDINIDSSKFDLAINENYVFVNNYLENTIITNDMIISKENFSENDMEIIAISLSNIEDSVGYSLGKNDFVNIYYNAKLHEVTNFIDTLSQNKYYTGEGTSTSVMIKLFENVQVIDIYTNSGKGQNTTSNSSNKIEGILINVKKEEAIMYNSLKEKGSFSASIIK